MFGKGGGGGGGSFFQKAARRFGDLMRFVYLTRN